MKNMTYFKEFAKYSLLNVLGIGGAIKYSIAKSQNEMDNANHIFTNTVLLALAFAVIFLIQKERRLQL